MWEERRVAGGKEGCERGKDEEKQNTWQGSMEEGKGEENGSRETCLNEPR